jgi:hypothetical protein
MNELTAAKVRDLLDYDPETGEFVWLKGKTSGKVAGCVAKDGYWLIVINRRLYYAHRLAWLHVHGEWPHRHIDHRDGDRRNNRIDNLRPATVAENAQNRVAYRTNKSGYLGVVALPRGGFVAQIMVDGKRKRLGSHSDPAEAHKLYLAAKSEMHKFQPQPRLV